MTPAVEHPAPAPAAPSPVLRRGRWWALYLGAGLATAALHWRIAHLAAPETGTVLGLYGLGFLFYLAALPAARRLAAGRSAAALVFCFLVAGFCLGTYLRAPVPLRSEVDRYRWDGQVAEAGFNPYSVTPLDPELAEVRRNFQGEILHPERRGLYAPLAELGFYLMARAGTDSLVAYRALFSVMALLAGLAFLPLARAAGVAPTRLTVFLWHPLLILETAGHAHLEAAAILFLLVGLSLLMSRHQLTPMGTLGLATLLRPYPIALFPLYLRRIPLYRIVVFFLVLLLGTLPFAAAWRDLAAGLADFLSHARFNPGPYLLAEAFFRFLGRPEWTRAAIALTGLGIAFRLYLNDDGTNASILRRAFYLSLLPLLLGPVVAPWYLLWLIPFLALVGTGNPYRIAVLYLTGSAVLGYLAPDGHQAPAWVPWVEYGPVAVLAGLGFWFRRRRRRAAPDQAPEDPVPGTT